MQLPAHLAPVADRARLSADALGSA
jgi:hypothetical protein